MSPKSVVCDFPFPVNFLIICGLTIACTVPSLCSLRQCLSIWRTAKHLIWLFASKLGTNGLEMLQFVVSFPLKPTPFQKPVKLCLGHFFPNVTFMKWEFFSIFPLNIGCFVPWPLLYCKIRRRGLLLGKHTRKNIFSPLKYCHLLLVLKIFYFLLLMKFQ